MDSRCERDVSENSIDGEKALLALGQRSDMDVV